MRATTFSDRITGRSETTPAADASAGRQAQRFVAIGLVALIHGIVFVVLARSFVPAFPARSAEEIQVNFLSPNMGPREPLAPPLDWTFETPQDVVVPQPELAITPDQEGSEGIVASAIDQNLPPRLDPAHVNERPELPGTFGDLIKGLSLQMRLRVLADGSIAQARIVRSTGEGAIDRLAIDCVRNRWRYLPASINGKPIEAWMTVIVRFAPIH